MFGFGSKRFTTIAGGVAYSALVLCVATVVIGSVGPVA